MDVEIPRHRSEPVRGIKVRVRTRVPCPAPQPFVARFEQDLAQVVQVRGLRVQHLAEHARVHHAVHEHLGLAVAAVLEVQAMFAGLLRCVDQRPQILERRADRAFAAAVLAGVERGEHHGDVPFPGRGRVDEVDVVALHEVFERVIAAAVRRGRGMAGVGDHLRGLRHLVGDDVADRDDLHVVDGEQLAEHGAAAESGADDADADGVVPLERNRAHRLPARWRDRREIGVRDRVDVLRDGGMERAARRECRACERRALQ